ncbi:MAG: hypothetical protein HQL71_09565 [Magnetococcales bacterium]|nr:hypothetical protein [Magnetococcales bacterium]
MEFFRVSVFTTCERNKAINQVRNAIVGSEGWIIDHTLFSNILATISFDLPCNKVDNFIKKLKKATFTPKIDGKLPKKGDGDLKCQISISFIHDEPTLKRDIPAFG